MSTCFLLTYYCLLSRHNSNQPKKRARWRLYLRYSPQCIQILPRHKTPPRPREALLVSLLLLGYCRFSLVLYRRTMRPSRSSIGRARTRWTSRRIPHASPDYASACATCTCIAPRIIFLAIDLAIQHGHQGCQHVFYSRTIVC